MDYRPLSRLLGLDTFKMAFDSATVFTAQAPPTPTDTPRQTPSRGSSRHARRRRSSSPPSIPRDEGSLHGEQEATKDEGNGEDISPLDPRRFTPNLHASLVSQILTLQHEVENRNKTVNNLEESLDIAKTENEKLNNSLKDQAKEYRSMRKQMQLLESTTLTALENIAKERDDATENLADTRKTLETSKSRIRNQEEEVTRAQSLWDTERQKWNIERHNMETKVELVEGRLKTVLAEIAAVEVNGHEYPRTSVELDEGVHGTWYTKRSDSISSRSNSGNGQTRFSGLSNATNEVSEYLNFRASTLSGLNGFGGNRPNGMSLADELDFREDEDDCEGEGAGGMTSPDALLGEAQFNRRRPSVQSTSQDHKAWKRLGLLPENVEQTIEEERLTEKRAAAHGNNHNLTEKPSIEGEKVIYPKKATAVQYIDSATQISPPASPNIRPQSDVSEKVTERTSIMEHTANQSRKRVSSLMIEQMTPLKPVTQLVSPMASAGCQTIDQSPSPPLTPIIAIEPVASASVHADKVVEMISSSMQTDEQEQTVLASVSTRQKPSSVMIPVIEIHPPGSRPPSFHNSVVLPPRTKNAGCQASIELPVSSRSISVQTDVVISGKLPVDLPPKSMPKTASQSSLPQIGLEKIDERSQQPPQQPPRTSSRKNLERKLPIGSSRPQIKPSFSAPAIDTYPVNNDSGPLTSRQPASLRRPVRSGSLFAGFDSTFTDGSLKLKDFDLSSDDDFATVPPIRKTLSKVQNSWKLIPRSKNEFLGRLKSAKNSMDNLDIGESPDPWLASLVPLGEHEQATAKASGDDAGRKDLRSSEDIKQSSTRQAASRATARGPSVQRRQSPSAPNLPKKDFGTVAPPPFPVPTRSSSRRIPISASEGARSPTPDTTTFFSTARKSEAGRSPSQNPLRKVRSAAAVPRERSNGQARTPPQPISPSMLASDSPQLPRMLSSDVTSRNPKATQHVQHTTHALPPASLSGEALTDTPGQSTSVVDAIAQTMVGEWMWKYVRRRKSFGITDDVDFDANGNGKGDGIRHKRWVWLAPYERAVIWSSKQPTSGPALMGKHGRKRKHSGHQWRSSTNQVDSQHSVSLGC